LQGCGNAVLILHGTTGSGNQFFNNDFAGELFGPGQPLDAAKYYIIIPDGIGHGKSTKPSDGMKTAFPKYDYDDMVQAQLRLVKDGLGLKHLRLVIGNSMGGMHAWLWAEKYPDLMDAVVPMAAQPTAMAARNWMLRRIMIETIRGDPDYNDGNYTRQPRMMKYALAAYGFATSGGTLAYQSQAPTAEKADKMIDERLATPIACAHGASATLSIPMPTISSATANRPPSIGPRSSWATSLRPALDVDLVSLPWTARCPRRVRAKSSVTAGNSSTAP